RQDEARATREHFAWNDRSVDRNGEVALEETHRRTRTNETWHSPVWQHRDNNGPIVDSRVLNGGSNALTLRAADHRRQPELAALAGGGPERSEEIEGPFRDPDLPVDPDARRHAAGRSRLVIQPLERAGEPPQVQRHGSRIEDGWRECVGNVGFE